MEIFTAFLTLLLLRRELIEQSFDMFYILKKYLELFIQQPPITGNMF